MKTMTKKRFRKLLMRRVDRNRANEFVEYIAQMKSHWADIHWDYPLVLQCLRFHCRHPKYPAFAMCIGLDNDD